MSFLKQTLVAACALVGAASLYADDTTPVVGTTSFYSIQAPICKYSDGATLLAGERFEVSWVSADGATTKTKNYTANADGSFGPVFIQGSTATFNNGYFSVVYADTRTTPTTLGTTVFAKYTAAAQIKASVISTSGTATTDKPEDVMTTVKSTGDATFTGSIAIVDGKPRVNVAGNATIVIEESADLKNWTIVDATKNPVRVFGDKTVSIDTQTAEAPTKFFRIIKK